MGSKIEGRLAFILVFVLIAFLLGSGIGIAVGGNGVGLLKSNETNIDQNDTMKDLNVTKLPDEPVIDNSNEYDDNSNQNYNNTSSQYYSFEDLHKNGQINKSY
ncbi:MAG: hypothetical protein LBM96_10130 [Methanobrevibacter sp.]|nr:hypothetical protein [Candidatus Methanoflexus mossambicus]